MEIKKWRRDKEREEKLLRRIASYGTGNWGAVPKGARLNRSSKSCTKRRKSYEDPNKKGGSIAAEEELEIIRLRTIYGNSCAKMASDIKARTAMIKCFPQRYCADTDGTAVACFRNGGQEVPISSSAATNDKTLEEWTEKVAKLDEWIEEMVTLPPSWADSGIRGNISHHRDGSVFSLEV